MRIGYVLLGEGLGADAKNALTVIGLNQNILMGSALPTVTKRAVVLHLEDVDFPSGSTAEVSFTVRAPSGRVLMAQTTGFSVGERVFDDVPVTADIPAEFMLNVTEYGPHVIVVEVRPQGADVLTAEVSLYVRQPPETASAG